MRILITNDDGVSAEGLIPLARWCKRLGDVTVVVPKNEQSAKSHGIEIHAPFEVQLREIDGVEVYTVDSTPADCVRYAVLGMELKFDLIISGINRGLNIGTDILYSGTVSAAREAAILGLPAIALSTPPEYYDRAVEHLDEVFGYINERGLLDIHSTYNINIPENPKGIRITRQGGSYYSDSFDDLGEGMFKAHGKCVYASKNNPTLDTEATMTGYISVMPITIDMTAVEVYDRLK